MAVVLLWQCCCDGCVPVSVSWPLCSSDSVVVTTVFQWLYCCDGSVPVTVLLWLLCSIDSVVVKAGFQWYCCCDLTVLLRLLCSCNSVIVIAVFHRQCYDCSSECYSDLSSSECCFYCCVPVTVLLRQRCSSESVVVIWQCCCYCCVPVAVLSRLLHGILTNLFQWGSPISQISYTLVLYCDCSHISHIIGCRKKDGLFNSTETSTFLITNCMSVSIKPPLNSHSEKKKDFGNALPLWVKAVLTG